jgi:hypothetical protein
MSKQAELSTANDDQPLSKSDLFSRRMKRVGIPESGYNKNHVIVPTRAASGKVFQVTPHAPFDVQEIWEGKSSPAVNSRPLADYEPDDRLLAPDVEEQLDMMRDQDQSMDY